MRGDRFASSSSLTLSARAVRRSDTGRGRASPTGAALSDSPEGPGAVPRIDANTASFRPDEARIPPGLRPRSAHGPPTNSGKRRSTTGNGGQRRGRKHQVKDLLSGVFAACPRQDSNLRTRLRRPMLYPLSYEGGMTREAG